MQSEVDLLKHRIFELEAKKTELETKNAKLIKQKKILSIKIETDPEKGITTNPLPKIEDSSTQSESLTEPETSTTSLPQDIIGIDMPAHTDDDSAEILDFVETIYKERISKKGTENITQMIADGIQDNIISDESEAQSFASSNHVTEISVTARRQNSGTISLLDLVQLFDKATDAEYYAIKANQEESLYWINIGKNLKFSIIILKSHNRNFNVALRQNHITEIPGSKKLPKNEETE
ncbi:16674_t:CDS:2, partial [Gigaspora margarita]